MRKEIQFRLNGEAVSAQVSPDFSELYFLYPQLKVSSAQAGVRVVGRCDILLRLELTPGWQVELTDLRIQGQSTMSADASGPAEASIEVVGADESPAISASATVTGPTAAQGWDAVSDIPTGYVACESSVTLRVNTEVTSSGSGMAAGVAHMSMTTAATGFSGANTATLQYRRCAR